jgi:hypothetical protein
MCILHATLHDLQPDVSRHRSVYNGSEFVDAVSTNQIGDSLADLARRVQAALEEEEDADELVHTGNLIG